MKSPSNPWPIASCNRIPGHPGPSTTTCSPAGAGTACNIIFACDTALWTSSFQFCSVKKSLYEYLPPKPTDPVSFLPLSSSVTLMFNLTSGLISDSSCPEGLKISTFCHDPERFTETCFTLLS